MATVTGSVSIAIKCRPTVLLSRSFPEEGTSRILYYIIIIIIIIIIIMSFWNV
jgi:hypothetical protein